MLEGERGGYWLLWKLLDQLCISKVLHGQEAVEWCSPCLLRGGQTQIHTFKSGKQGKQFHTGAALPEEVSKDKNLATTDRMKCPIKLFKSFGKEYNFSGLTSGRTLQKAEEGRGGEKSLSQGLNPARQSLSPTAGQQPQLSFEGQF